MGLELERSREWCGRVYPTTRVIRLRTRKCRPLRPSSASTSQPVRAPAESFLRSLALVREATTFGGFTPLQSGERAGVETLSARVLFDSVSVVDRSKTF